MLPHDLQTMIDQILIDNKKSNIIAPATLTLAKPQNFTRKTGCNTPLIFIGDCHGHANGLATLLQELLGTHPTAKIIFTGDLIDRGPQSPECLRLAITAAILTGGVFLPGNHEQMMLAALTSSDELSKMPTRQRQNIEMLGSSFIMNGGGWIFNLPDGGVEAFSKPELWLDANLPDSVMTEIHKTSPNVREWLLSRPLCARFGDILAVHAGIPYRTTSIAEIENTSLFGGDGDTGPLWVRKPFLTHTGAFPENVFVIHGHTPDRSHLEHIENGTLYKPHENRLCIDALSFNPSKSSLTSSTGTIAAAIVTPGKLQMAYATYLT